VRLFRVLVLVLVVGLAYVALTSGAAPPVAVVPPTRAPIPTATATPPGQPVPIPTVAPVSRGDHDIEILDDLFSPVALTIPAGRAVVWHNFGQRAHDIHSPTGAWHTVVLQPGQTANLGFNTPGTFEYVCSYHASMQGRIIVK
jgi:plastocyanin